jgi:hypothetical protein
MDARPALERVDAQPAVVGQGGQAGEVRRLARLEVGIVGEGRADLLGLGQIELRRGQRLDAVRAEQLGDLAHLSLIVAGDDQLAGPQLPHRPVALSWAAKMSPQPIRARRSSRSRSSSL